MFSFLLRQTTRSGTAGSYGKRMFNILRNCQHPHQAGRVTVRLSCYSHFSKWAVVPHWFNCALAQWLTILDIFPCDYLPSDVFVEVSMQILLFFNLVVCPITIAVKDLHIIRCFRGCMIYKYFLLLGGLYFHFLNGIFLKAKFLNVDIQFISFSFCWPFILHLI